LERIKNKIEESRANVGNIEREIKGYNEQLKELSELMNKIEKFEKRLDDLATERKYKQSEKESLGANLELFTGFFPFFFLFSFFFWKKNSLIMIL